MKCLYYLVVLLLASCTVSTGIRWNKKVSKELYKQQVKLSDFAKVSLLAREQNIGTISQLKLGDSDTLFLIERISEPDLQYWCNIWSSRRDTVIEYSNLDGVNTSKVLVYPKWNIKLKDVTEKFDTTKVEQVQLLGGYRTFISAINSKGIKTFWFHDKYSSFEE